MCQATSASSDAMKLDKIAPPPRSHHSGPKPVLLHLNWRPRRLCCSSPHPPSPRPPPRPLPPPASACALVAGALAAEKSSHERFADFARLSRTATPIQLNTASYKSLTANPRDYAVAVVLTAQEARFSCQVCREFKPEWELLAQSWAKGDRNHESRLLFAVLDFTEGRDIFVSVWETSRK